SARYRREMDGELTACDTRALCLEPAEVLRDCDRYWHEGYAARVQQPAARGDDTPEDCPQLRGVRRRPYEPDWRTAREKPAAVFLEESCGTRESDIARREGLTGSRFRTDI